MYPRLVWPQAVVPILGPPGGPCFFKPVARGGNFRSTPAGPFRAPQERIVWPPSSTIGRLALRLCDRDTVSGLQAVGGDVPAPAESTQPLQATLPLR